MSEDFHDDPAGGAYRLWVGGACARAEYRRDGEVLTILHVVVDDALRGSGAASRLMQGVAAAARAERAKINPECSYAARWFEKYPDERDLLI